MELLYLGSRQLYIPRFQSGPRGWLQEKALSHGAAFLSDAELLAISLRVATKGKTVVALAKDLPNQLGSVAKLLNSDAT